MTKKIWDLYAPIYKQAIQCLFRQFFCSLDYTMSEAGGVTDFVRQYTLASGGPYCDCGYKRKAVE